MDPASLVSFYERAYSREPEKSALNARWRALGAAGKADHVMSLCARAGLSPQATAEVGCGDGALLSELHARGFGGRLAGAEISEAAARLARARDGIEEVAVFDGDRLPWAAGAFDLGVLSHVLEHVSEPASLLAEVARTCGAVVLEVPLEHNLSARRSSRRDRSAEVGHLQRLDRRAARSIVARAGLEVAAELTDPLPRAVHRFFAATTASRLAADARWAVRAAAHGTAGPLARRLFTVHYACLCLSPGSAGAARDAGVDHA